MASEPVILTPNADWTNLYRTPTGALRLYPSTHTKITRVGIKSVGVLSDHAPGGIEYGALNLGSKGVQEISATLKQHGLKIADDNALVPLTATGGITGASELISCLRKYAATACIESLWQLTTADLFDLQNAANAYETDFTKFILNILMLLSRYQMTLQQLPDFRAPIKPATSFPGLAQKLRRQMTI